MGPIDYRIDVAQPVNNSMAGLQQALAIKQGVANANYDEARTAQVQQATDVAAALRSELVAVAQNPSTDAVAKLMLKYPQLSEHFQRGLNALGAEQQKARTSEAQQVYASILNGKPEIGEQILMDAAAAFRDKGQAADAQRYETMAKLIKLNPAGAETTIGMMLATAMGPDKFGETFKTLEDQRRSRVTEGDVALEAKSKAASAAVAAKFAESNAVLDLQKKGWDITKLQEDVKLARLNQQIAVVEASTKKQLAPLQVQEAQEKLADLRAKRETMVNERAADAMGAFTTVNETANLLTDILSDANRDNLEAAVGASAWRGWLPGSEARTVAGKLGRLESILASANLDQLKGAMSDKDIMFLKQIGANLDRFQDEKRAIAELQRVRNAVDGARAKLITKYGLPKAAPAGAASQSESSW